MAGDHKATRNIQDSMKQNINIKKDPQEVLPWNDYWMA